MKAALIPPKGYEHTVLHSNIHLVLPLPSLVGNPNYVHAYKFARARGDYIILDNGCAEGQLVSSAALMSFAQTIGADEIVAPDVMSDAAGTLELTKDFLETHPMAANYNIMAVLQGTEMHEREYLLDQYAKIDAITTIGVPKVLVTSRNTAARVDTVNMINERYPGRFKIHLLGLSEFYPIEIAFLTFKGVRSMDSAQPYKLTEIGRPLAPNGRMSHAPRRPDYFEAKKEVDPRLLMANIFTFLEWAQQNEG